jgi:hypothetical protein
MIDSEFDSDMEDFISDIDAKAFLDNDNNPPASYDDDGMDEFVSDIDKKNLNNDDGIKSFPLRREEDDYFDDDDWDVL